MMIGGWGTRNVGDALGLIPLLVSPIGTWAELGFRKPRPALSSRVLCAAACCAICGIVCKFHEVMRRLVVFYVIPAPIRLNETGRRPACRRGLGAGAIHWPVAWRHPDALVGPARCDVAWRPVANPLWSAPRSGSVRPRAARGELAIETWGVGSGGVPGQKMRHWHRPSSQRWQYRSKLSRFLDRR